MNEDATFDIKILLAHPNEKAFVVKVDEDGVKAAVFDTMFGEPVNEENIGEIPLEESTYILYDKTAADNDKPMNRVIPFVDGRRFLMSGVFVIVNKDADGKYYSLTDEQADKYYKVFCNPQLFVVAFGKMLVFEMRNSTEINMVHVVDLNEELNNEEPGGEPNE